MNWIKRKGATVKDIIPVLDRIKSLENNLKTFKAPYSIYVEKELGQMYELLNLLDQDIEVKGRAYWKSQKI